MYEFGSRLRRENTAANGGATKQSCEFRRTYGIESASIGQGSRRGRKTKFGEEKLHLMISVARPQIVQAGFWGGF